MIWMFLHRSPQTVQYVRKTVTLRLRKQQLEYSAQNVGTIEAALRHGLRRLVRFSVREDEGERRLPPPQCTENCRSNRVPAMASGGFPRSAKSAIESTFLLRHVVLQSVAVRAFTEKTGRVGCIGARFSSPYGGGEIPTLLA